MRATIVIGSRELDGMLSKPRQLLASKGISFKCQVASPSLKVSQWSPNRGCNRPEDMQAIVTGFAADYDEIIHQSHKGIASALLLT